ncbi:hypothetical protein LVJ94_24130 [Pendulispora rubella]|uniref:Uncharacterized protein n=1 Tax=Pendulispora rubella TaxID=2741070 RepID=A0ABZ2LMD0_9BACT
MKTVLKSLLSIPVLALTATGVVVLMVACSGSSNSNGGGSDDKKTDSGNDDDDSGTKTDAGDDEDDAGKDANGNPGAPCIGETKVEACLACCDTTSSGGRAVINKAFQDCNCKDGSECKADCGDNYCSGKPASAECAQCLKESEVCEETAKTACDNDSKCAAYRVCATNSECDDKDP